MSDYQNAKLIILSILEISKDAIHIHVGLIVVFCGRGPVLKGNRNNRNQNGSVA